MVKRNYIALFVIFILLMTNVSLALQKKPVESIDSDELTDETQIFAPCEDDQFNLVWWIPIEFWDNVFSSDKTISASERELMLKTLSPYSIIGICQADISDFGTFDFYEKSEVEKNLDIKYVSKDNKSIEIKPAEKIDPDVNLMLNMMKPVLTAAMGNMGENFHFYVISEKSERNERQINPYEAGFLQFTLGCRDRTFLKATLEFPLNSLYVPRKCPNGKYAHVSWKYCPWTGEKLPD